MPSAGAEPRAEQEATLARVRHERLTADETGALLEELRPYERDAPYESDEASLVRIGRRDFDKARRVPTELRTEIVRAGSEAQRPWAEARAKSDFTIFFPYLERNIDLKRRYAECFDFEDPYDALLDDFEPGMRTAQISALLDDLKQALIPIVARAAEATAGVDDSFLSAHFPEHDQRRVVRAILDDMPLAPGSWRLDEAQHPFASAFGRDDVRLTSRYAGRFPEGIFAAVHEFGHGLYENGVDKSLERTPLARPTSLGLHESQSRMWENMIGRSLPFWRRHYPRVQETFSEQLGDIDVESFHRALNKVQRSLIRIEADQATYDLHVVLRFELEREIFRGALAPAELPEAWNERVRTYLGLDVPNDAQGVLQDIHWADGSFGYFPTYSLGNIISGQLWQAARKALPELDEQIERGDLWPLREWLREHVHRHGRKFSAGEIVERVTGGPIEVGSYVAYLEEKFRVRA
jgi:carboxypeptidase Taq